MHFLLWLIAGGFVGWITNLILRNSSWVHLAVNIVIGATGAFIGAGLIAPLLSLDHSIDDGTYSFISIAMALGGAAILLVLFNLVRHRLPIRR